MKAIIDRTLYNTETAECVAVYSSHHNRGDFRHFEEHLYRTRRGNWFLHGEGGPASTYSERCGNNTVGSEKIIPMDEDDVVEWLELRQMVGVLETRFPNYLTEA